MILLADVKKAVCMHFGIHPDRLSGPSRERRVVRPRHIGMYVAAEHCRNRPMYAIGQAFGRIDGHAVLYAMRSISDLKERDPSIAESVEAVYRNAEAIALRRQHEASFRDPFARPQA